MFKVALTTIVIALAAVAVCPAQTVSVGGNGVLEYRVRQIDLHRSTRPNVAAVSIAFEIKNVGTTPVAIAFMSPGPTVQMDGGLSFIFAGTKPSGLAWCNTTTVAGCDPYAHEFTAVRPGQSLTASMTLYVNRDPRQVAAPAWGLLTGDLYMRDLDSGKSTREAFTLSDVKVLNNLR
jgi:hypothetical protein